GGSFGAGNYSMCGRAYSPRFLWMWPNAKIAVMGGPQAAGTLASVRAAQVTKAGGEWTDEQQEEFTAPIREQFEEQSTAYYSTARLWDDGIIDPADTRSEEHTSELQSRFDLVCRLLLEKKKQRARV